MTAATGCALLANDGLTAIWAKARGIALASNWQDALTAPLDEEVLKVCGVAMIVLAVPLAIRGPLDGLIFGALVGMGFQAIENFTYGLNAIVQYGATSPPLAVASSAYIRAGLTGLGSHWAMTGVAGAGIGFIAARGGRGAGPAAGLLLAAIAMHFLFDSPPMTAIGITLIKVAVNFGVIVTLYLVLRHGYVGRARSALAADAAVGTINQDEAHSLLSRRRRRRARRHVPRGPERARVAARQQSQLARLEQYAAAGGTFPVAVTIPAQSPPATPPQAQPMPRGSMGELTHSQAASAASIPLRGSERSA